VLELAHMVKTAAAKWACGRDRAHAVAAHRGAGTLLQREAFELVDLGLRPHFLSDSLLDSLMNIAMKYQDRVDRSLFVPQVNWRNSRNLRTRKAAAALSMSGD